MKSAFICQLCLLLAFTAWGQRQEALDDFSIMSVDGKDTLFTANHVVIHYSEDGSHASILHQNHYRLVFNLPFHRFRTDHLEAVWDIKGQRLYFHSNDTHDRFYSTDTTHMELEFSSADATLDLKTKTLSVRQVPGIYTGNAMVVPQDHEMSLSSHKIPPLPKAQIILNSFTRYHHLISNEVHIHSRKDFKHGHILHYEYYHIPTRKHYRFDHVRLHTEKVVEEYRISFTTTIHLKIKEADNFELFKGQLFRGSAIAKDHEDVFFFKGEIGELNDGKLIWRPYEGNGFLGKF